MIKVLYTIFFVFLGSWIFAMFVFYAPIATVEDKPIAILSTPDPCGLEEVVCEKELSVGDIIRAIAIIETSGGTKGVGASKNNPCSIKCGVDYCTYETLNDGYNAATKLWSKYYDTLPIERALKKWKHGPNGVWDESVDRYIANFWSVV